MVAQINKRYVLTRPSRIWSRLLSYLCFEGRPLTTKGRWINPFLFLQFKLFTILWQFKKVNKPIFILGTGRSGTTILGMVLSMHSEIGFLNEPKAIWAFLNDKEDLIGSYNRNNASYRLTEHDASKNMELKAHRIYGAYLFFTLSKRVVDKYPEMIFRTPFIRKIFPDAKFLFLSRNGIDTCSSIEQWSSRQGKKIGGENQDWWGAEDRKWKYLIEQIVIGHPDLSEYSEEISKIADHRVKAAVEWIVTMREGIDLLKKFPADVIHVNYEKLCKDPEKILLQISRFLDLSADEKFIKYGEDVLKPTVNSPAFELPIYLEAPFRETQENLNSI